MWEEREDIGILYLIIAGILIEICLILSHLLI
jgi:hypothetical protein